MRGIPGMQVFCPADLDELVDALPAILSSKAPSYVRYHLDPRALALPAARPFAVGRAETVFEGRDVALLTYGFLLREAGKARDLLEARGISTRLVNLRSLKPVDEEALVQAASCPLVVAIEDHFETGGLFTVVAETLVRRGLAARVVPFAFRERWFTPGLLPDVLRKEGFDGNSLARRVLQALDGEA
jgi:transketolase